MAKKRKTDAQVEAPADQAPGALASLDLALPAPDPGDQTPAEMAQEDDWRGDEDGDITMGGTVDQDGIDMSSGKDDNGKGNSRMAAARAARKDRDPNAPRPRYIIIGQKRHTEDWEVLHVAKSAKGAAKWLEDCRALIRQICTETTVFRAKPVQVIAY